MTVKGIKIYEHQSENLIDILKEIHHGDLLHWSILNLYASGHLGEGKSIVDFENQILKSEKGFFISWNDLISLSNKFWEIIQILIIGCKDEKLLHRYESDQEMYETCDIVIELIDSAFWEVFSKDEDLINRLAAKFKKIEFLESDFQNKFY